MTRALIPYERQLFTFEERLLLGEAARRMDFAKYNQIVMAATIRSLNIPAWMLLCDPQAANYSSARLGQ